MLGGRAAAAALLGAAPLTVTPVTETAAHQPAVSEADPATVFAGVGTAFRTDFDGDGDDELVIATPSESVGTINDAGAVTVLDGSPSGVTTAGAQIWNRGSPGVPGSPSTGDRLGEAWTSGDFDGDGFDDLAIGIPQDDPRGVLDSGTVQVLFGSPVGLTTDGQQLLRERDVEVPEPGDRFGAALAAGDFDNDGDDDLAVGAPGEAIGGQAGAGAVFVFRGRPAGLAASPSLWSQDRPGIAGSAEAGDAFGAALAAGRVGYGARDDLVVGAPREDIGGAVDAGAVHVLYGKGGGFATTTDQLFVLDDFEAGLGGSGPNDELSSDPGDRFGTSVAIAEEGDTLLPLVLAGAPFDDDGGILGVAADVGAVGVLRGVQGSGVQPLGGHLPNSSSGDFRPGQQFGRAITGLGSGSWAVSWPGYEPPLLVPPSNSGLVSVFTLTPEITGEDRYQQNDLGETAEDDDEFGAAVWSADVDGDGGPELAIGWRESLELEGVEQAGMVGVIVLPEEGFETFTQSTPGVPETNEPFDRFGTQLVP